MCVKYKYASPAVSAYAHFSDEQGVDLLEHVCQLE